MNDHADTVDYHSVMNDVGHLFLLSLLQLEMYNTQARTYYPKRGNKMDLHSSTSDDLDNTHSIPFSAAPGTTHSKPPLCCSAGCTAYRDRFLQIRWSREGN